MPKATKSSQSYRKIFSVPEARFLSLSKIAPDQTRDFKHHEDAQPEIDRLLQRLRELQELLYATKTHSVLIVLQGLDAAGKDGVVRHVLSGLNPEGVKVAAFKQPTPDEAAHDFLWRAHAHAPEKGEIAIFNRSHYEDVLVVRVHGLAPKSAWKPRFKHIRNFENLLADQNQTILLKFFLHISPEEQLTRFAVRLDEPDHEWKISNSDYTERELWDAYIQAFEEAIAKTSTEAAPWFVIPSDHKWFRDLAIARILVETLEALPLTAPKPGVDIPHIRGEFEKALEEEPKELRKKIRKRAAKKEKKLRKSQAGK